MPLKSSSILSMMDIIWLLVLLPVPAGIPFVGGKKAVKLWRVKMRILFNRQAFHGSCGHCIDVFKMALKEGWDTYPIGSGAKADSVSKGSLAGIVTI